MAALSPAQANEASLWLAIFLMALLALSLAAVITSPPPDDTPPAEKADAEPDPPEPGNKPPASPLPRRAAGQPGAAHPAPRPLGGPYHGRHRPGTIRPPRTSPGPPWEPAPKPPRLPSQVQYGAQVINTRTGRTWRCPHDHPTPESATRCADAMQERIERLGWDQATGQSTNEA
jgi:hypothetical protein